MRNLLFFATLLPLAVCLPPFIKEGEPPVPTEILPEGKKWLDLAQFDWDDYELTGVSLDCQRSVSNIPYNCLYKFHWNDPNYNEAIDCNATFMWDGVTLQKSAKNDYPDGFYESCTRGNWSQFKFDTVRSLWDFNMTINKDHKDPSKFGPNTATFYAYPNITMEKMGEEGFTSLVYAATRPVKAKIQGLVL